MQSLSKRLGFLLTAWSHHMTRGGQCFTKSCLYILRLIKRQNVIVQKSCKGIPGEEFNLTSIFAFLARLIMSRVPREFKMSL